MVNDEVGDAVPKQLSLDEAFRAAYYLAEQYVSLEAKPEESLVLFLQYLRSDPARWDDWKQAVRVAIADGGAPDDVVTVS